MDKQNINKIVTFSFVAFAMLVWWVSGFLLDTAASTFSVVAQWRSYRIGGIEMFRTVTPIIFGLIVFVMLQFSKARRSFAQDVVLETSKAVWPSAKDVQGSTIVVVIMILISAVVLFTLDWVANEAIRTILGL